MPREHPDDTTFLLGLHWVHGTCAACPAHRQPNGQQVTEVDHVEQGSGAGYPIRYCRSCLAYRLVLDRARAEVEADEGYTPSLDGYEAAARGRAAG